MLSSDARKGRGRAPKRLYNGPRNGPAEEDRAARQVRANGSDPPTALDRAPSQRRKSAYLPSDTLELLRPQVFQLEQFADELARDFGDDRCVRLGDTL